MFDWNQIVWPLAFLLVALTLLRQLRNDLTPIFKSVIGGVAKNAQSNALVYGLAIIAATLSSLQELSAVAREQHWLYAEIFCRVLQPALGTALAFAMKPPSSLSVDINSKPTPATPSA